MHFFDSFLTRFKNFFSRFFAVFLFLFFTLLAGGLTWFIQTGSFLNEWDRLKLKTQKASADAGLSLKKVFIEGRVRTRVNDIHLALSVRENMPIMAIDLERIKENLELLPWVESARIERYLPSSLYIFLTEKTPIALYQEKSIHIPLDDKGNLIETSVQGLENFPIVVGQGSAKKAPALIALLEDYPELNNRVKSLKRIGNRRWNIILDDLDYGLTLLLPEENEKEALQRLDKLNKEQKILEKNLSEIDLRLKDRLIVKGGKKKPLKKDKITPEQLVGERNA